MDALDQLAKADPKEVMALLFWKDRHRNPEMAAQITEKDIAEFKACTEYLSVTPKVRIQRPQGIPAQERIPASGNRREVPAREAIPPKPYVIVQVVDQNGDSFKPIESDEEGAKKRDLSDMLRQARDNAPMLSAQLAADARTGNYSSSLVLEAAEALAMLAKS